MADYNFGGPLGNYGYYPKVNLGPSSSSPGLYGGGVTGMQIGHMNPFGSSPSGGWYGGSTGYLGGGMTGGNPGNWGNVTGGSGGSIGSLGGNGGAMLPSLSNGGLSPNDRTLNSMDGGADGGYHAVINRGATLGSLYNSNNSLNPYAKTQQVTSTTADTSSATPAEQAIAKKKSSTPWGAIGAGVLGGVASMFGGGGSDHGMGEAQQGEKSANANQESLANQYRGLGGQQMDYMGQDQAAQRKATADYANYLRQDPNTDQQRASDMAKMTAGMAGAYQRARAQLAVGNTAANGGSAGIGSAPSSQANGGNNYLLAQQAGTLAGAQASEFNNIQADRERRLQALQGLYTGQTGQDYNMGTGFLGSAGQGYQNVFSNYNTMYNQDAAQAQAEAANSPWATIGKIAPYFSPAAKAASAAGGA